MHRSHHSSTSLSILDEAHAYAQRESETDEGPMKLIPTCLAQAPAPACCTLLKKYLQGRNIIAMRWFTRGNTPSAPIHTLSTNGSEAPSRDDGTSETKVARPRRSRRRLFGWLKITGMGAIAAGGAGILLQQNTGTAYASSGVFTSSVSSTPAVLATGTNGARGVSASSDSGYGVAGVSTSSVGVRGASTSGTGIWGTTTSGNAGVYGQYNGSSSAGVGTYGTSPNGYGVMGNSTSGIGVYATSGGHGVYGDTTGEGYAGVFGQDDSSTSYSFGVFASSTNGTGLYATGNVGVYAYTTTTDGYGLYASSGGAGTGTAGVFYGDVNVTGSLSKGGGSFLIDHPLDPANKSLYHSFVESPDMKNIYDGLAVLDANGEAVVTLPDWFGALNTAFRYQLTCLAGFAPVYIAKKIENNQFTIAGGHPGLEVSWQVTGIRQDAWAQQYRIPVEEMKTGEQRGRYYHPELFGAQGEQGIYYRPAQAVPHVPEGTH